MGRRRQTVIIEPRALQRTHPETHLVRPQPGVAKGSAGHLAKAGPDLVSVAGHGRDRNDTLRTDAWTFGGTSIVRRMERRYTMPPHQAVRARRRRRNAIAKASRRANR